MAELNTSRRRAGQSRSLKKAALLQAVFLDLKLFYSILPIAR
jgi:hypothetical protein